jgi:predicted transcriptional regulator of viral defense system
MAATLTFGPTAALSHRDAGALWALLGSSSPRIEVTVPGRSKRGREGIRVHCVRRLDPRDVTTKDGIPVTTVARTLLDNAEVVRMRQLERMLEEAERLRILDVAAIDELCERSRGRRGLNPMATRSTPTGRGRTS